MPLMSLAISLACQNAYGNHIDACGSALLASTKQLKLYETDEKVENYYILQANNFATNMFGNGIMGVAGGTAYVYKIYRDKTLDLRLPNMGVCDSVSSHITPNTYSINLGWNFPWFK